MALAIVGDATAKATRAASTTESFFMFSLLEDDQPLLNPGAQGLFQRRELFSGWLARSPVRSAPGAFVEPDQGVTPNA
jgi:hypothetical protein